MAFCTNCGNKIDENALFCTRCGTAVNNEFVSARGNSKQMYEEFIPTLGIGRRFVFKEKSIIYGNEEYDYSKLSPIRLITAPTFASNGVAQTTAENGVVLTLAFNRKDNVRFGAVLTYANEQIDKEHGNIKKYNFLLQSSSGSKIEVYEDYLKIYYFKAMSNKGSESVDKIGKNFGLSGKGLTGKITGGLGKAFDNISNLGTGINNTFKGGATGEIIMFTDLNISIKDNTLIINEYLIPLGQQNIDKAKEIIAYIKNTLELIKRESETTTVKQEIWEPIKGKNREFSFYGEKLEIPENLDVYNSYRKKFKQIAEKYTEKVRIDYNAKVNDFISFMEFFLKIYKENLSPIIQKAVDILISEGIWNVTFDSFLEKHTSSFHLAIDDYNAMLESVRLTVEKNQNAVAGVMSNIPNMIGGGFGFKGALKGMAIAETFNIVKNGIGNNAMKIASSINPAQQEELYGRIKTDILFNRVLVDYWDVFITLVWILRQNGRDIWLQTKDVDQQAKNIFRNLTNPNFPQDKIIQALVKLILINPYNSEYYEFAISQFGQSDDIVKIKEYFLC